MYIRVLSVHFITRLSRLKRHAAQGQRVCRSYVTGGDLNVIPQYRTVPDRYNFCHARDLLARSVA